MERTWLPGFSKELALQSTLTTLILICCTSLSKKIDGTETSSDKHPSKKKTHRYRGEGAKETELIHPCGFLNSSILQTIYAKWAWEWHLRRQSAEYSCQIYFPGVLADAKNPSTTQNPTILKTKQPKFASYHKTSDHWCPLTVTLLDEDSKVRTGELLHIRPKQGTEHCISPPIIHWSLVCHLLSSISFTIFDQINPYG